MRRTALFLSVGAIVMLLTSGAMGAVVAVCHVPPGNPSQAKTVLVGAKAADAHLKNHAGDFLGFCACQVDEDCDEGEVCNPDSGECEAPPPDFLSFIACLCDPDSALAGPLCGECPPDAEVFLLCNEACGGLPPLIWSCDPTPDPCDSPVPD